LSGKITITLKKTRQQFDSFPLRPLFACNVTSAILILRLFLAVQYLLLSENDGFIFESPPQKQDLFSLLLNNNEAKKRELCG
jgi:hypothetical protein